MIRKAYSIRDVKSEVFNLPFFKNTHGEATRDLKTLVNDNQSTLSKYPQDYDLYFIGEYDDNQGLFNATTPPEFVINANSLTEEL